MSSASAARGRLKAGLESFLEVVVGALVLGLAVVVTLGVVYRKLGASLPWYDEVASVMLAWLTYYGAALAALKRAHIGFSGIVDALSGRVRVVVILLGEVCVIGFFALLAWAGMVVLDALAGDTLVSLPEVPTQFTQSVIPVGAVLFILAELLSIPDALKPLSWGAPTMIECEGSLQ
jgi:TRAP-type C4-dicarboxylate transport system permease small subunit